MSIPMVRANWLGNVRADVLAGLVVALALIPEAISFSILAGVDPKVGLYAAFSMAVVIAFKVVMKYRRLGIHVEVTGMNEASATMIGQHATHDRLHAGKVEALDGVPAHQAGSIEHRGRMSG